MQVTNALIYYITKDNLSLNAVDKPGFRRFIKTVCPLYNCPHETQFTKLIHNKYETLKEAVRNRLRSTGSICLTDVWTQMMNVKSYLGITGHFIHDFQLMSCLLGVIKCDQSKTGAYIADLLLDCCNDWDIELDNVSCVVTDNGANIVNAVKLQFGEKRHLPCFAHTLNLIASKSVPLYNEAYGACLDPVIDSDDEDVDESDIDDAKHNSPEENMIIFIKKMKRIIKFFKKSETAMRELRKLQVIDGKKECQCLMLILDVKTRWNSIMAMIERFLLIAGYVSRVLLIIPKSPPMLTSDELSVLKEVCKTLKPLEKVTTEMSAEKYVTCSKIIPLVRLLKISYGIMELESREAFSLKQRILHFISKYFKDIEKVRILATATLLDPRFKKIHFESALSASSAVFFVGLSS
ncbi:zinc finger BED domain-containing protein 6-like isoform X2 [Topomyia yanbarensis]|uniref:zinc finger BED domain-containing protein 6-like isoform X2 n=1 Tax=Topomyia yanbarensis TaxID=2498891 RepID=UPI00273AF303|nr:zinc finger BED domain-containing protein 6-like isoform X2 [Topomyia yanbarensis]